MVAIRCGYRFDRGEVLGSYFNAGFQKQGIGEFDLELWMPRWIEVVDGDELLYIKWQRKNRAIRNSTEEWEETQTKNESDEWTE